MFTQSAPHPDPVQHSRHTVTVNFGDATEMKPIFSEFPVALWYNGQPNTLLHVSHMVLVKIGPKQVLPEIRKGH